jgi:hypothetical protein
MIDANNTLALYFVPSISQFHRGGILRDKIYTSKDSRGQTFLHALVIAGNTDAVEAGLTRDITSRTTVAAQTCLCSVPSTMTNAPENVKL